MNFKVTSWAPSLLVENSPPRSWTRKYTMCNSHYIAAASEKQEGTLIERTWIVLCLTSSRKSHLFYKLIFSKENPITLIISMATAWNREPPAAGMDHHGGGDGGSMTNGVWRLWRGLLSLDKPQSWTSAPALQQTASKKPSYRALPPLLWSLLNCYFSSFICCFFFSIYQIHLRSQWPLNWGGRLMNRAANKGEEERIKGGNKDKVPPFQLFLAQCGGQYRQPKNKEKPPQGCSIWD